jgi:hypothetical protein
LSLLLVLAACPGCLSWLLVLAVSRLLVPAACPGCLSWLFLGCLSWLFPGCLSRLLVLAACPGCLSWLLVLAACPGCFPAVSLPRSQYSCSVSGAIAERRASRSVRAQTRVCASLRKRLWMLILRPVHAPLRKLTGARSAQMLRLTSLRPVHAPLRIYTGARTAQMLRPTSLRPVHAPLRTCNSRAGAK